MQLLPDPPVAAAAASHEHGAIAQLGERLLCKQEVAGSIPAGSTIAPAACPPFRLVRVPAHRRAMTRVLPPDGMKGSRDRAVLQKKASRQIAVSPGARRLLFNNLASFCFDAKFSSEMFLYFDWKCRVRNVNQLHIPKLLGVIWSSE